MQNGVKDTLKENSVAKNTQADKVEQTVKDAQKAAILQLCQKRLV